MDVANPIDWELSQELSIELVDPTWRDDNSSVQDLLISHFFYPHGQSKGQAQFLRVSLPSMEDRIAFRRTVMSLRDLYIWSVGESPWQYAIVGLRQDASNVGWLAAQYLEIGAQKRHDIRNRIRAENGKKSKALARIVLGQREYHPRPAINNVGGTYVVRCPALEKLWPDETGEMYLGFVQPDQSARTVGKQTFPGRFHFGFMWGDAAFGSERAMLRKLYPQLAPRRQTRACVGTASRPVYYMKLRDLDPVYRLPVPDKSNEREEPPNSGKLQFDSVDCLDLRGTMDLSIIGRMAEFPGHKISSACPQLSEKFTTGPALLQRLRCMPQDTEDPMKQ